MNAKLTLLLDTVAIEKGKHYAAQNNTSLSRLVQDYFLLLSQEDDLCEAIPVSNKLKLLRGIGSGAHSEDSYLTHVEQKHS